VVKLGRGTFGADYHPDRLEGTQPLVPFLRGSIFAGL